MKIIPIWVNYDVCIQTELNVPNEFEINDKNITEEYLNSHISHHLNKLLKSANFETTKIQVLLK